MTVPENVRINTQLPFPSLVLGGGPITVGKASGVWQIGFNIINLPNAQPPLANFPTDYLTFYDAVAKTFNNISLQQLQTALTLAPPSPPSASVQFNNAGAFGGDAAFTFSGGRLALGTGTVAGNSFAGSPVRLTWAADTNVDWLTRIAAFGNNGFSIVQLFTKTRGGGLDTHGAVSNGDSLFENRCYASDGTNWQACAQILVNVGGAVSPGIIPTTFNVLTTDANGLRQTRIFTTVAGQTQLINLDSTNTALVNRTVQARRLGNFLLSGAGVGMEFATQSPNSGVLIGGAIDSVMTGTGGGTEAFDLRFFNMQGGAPVEAARLSSNGRMQLGYNGAPVAPVQLQGSDVVFSQISTNSPWGIGQITFGNSAGVSGVVFAKSRNATPGVQTILNNGDRLMDFRAFGSDGVDYQQGALIQVLVDAAPAAGSMPARIIFSTTPSGSTGSVERLRLDSLGAIRMFCTAANGQSNDFSNLTELTTIAAAATTNTGIQIPAGSVVLGVSVRVVTTIPTAATFTVTAGGNTFNTAAVSTASGTTDRGTAAGPKYFSAATAVTITPNLTPASNTGQVRVTIHYYTLTPPTS